MNLKEIKLWIITEGMAGTENQCLAVADHLDNVTVEIKRIGLKFPFSTLSPFPFKRIPYWATEGIDWNDPAPDIIIASGRKAVPVALNFKESFKVFIQNPRIHPKHFNLVASPDHDGLYGDNVIVTHAAPTRVTSALLEREKNKFNLPHLPEKKIAILIGGNSKTHSMPANFADRLYDDLIPVMRTGEYGIMMTVSRRTPDHIGQSLRNYFEGENCVFYDGEGDNPYHAFLGHANYILVTEDSTSMLSDALTTGKPTYRLPISNGDVCCVFLRRNLATMSTNP